MHAQKYDYRNVQCCQRGVAVLAALTWHCSCACSNVNPYHFVCVMPSLPVHIHVCVTCTLGVSPMGWLCLLQLSLLWTAVQAGSDHVHDCIHIDDLYCWVAEVSAENKRPADRSYSEPCKSRSATAAYSCPCTSTPLSPYFSASCHLLHVILQQDVHIYSACMFCYDCLACQIQQK